jgi:hypothetical protein
LPSYTESMKAARITLLALACTLPLAAAAQWQWLDKDGRKVFSDKAPPPEIAPERVLKAPKGLMPVAASAQPSAPPSGQADAGNAAGGLPKPLGRDAALEERKRQLANADAEKKKAEDAKYASLRSDNCSRARTSKANYESGARISRVDAKGERVYMDESQRAAEMKHLDEVIARDCAQ